MNTPKAKETKTTGKRYSSVREMIAGEELGEPVAAQVERGARVSRYFVLYADGPDMESWGVYAEFDTLLAAKKYIERENKIEDASCYHNSVSWEHHIVQWISGVKTEVAVKKCVESYPLKLKGARA